MKEREIEKQTDRPTEKKKERCLLYNFFQQPTWSGAQGTADPGEEHRSETAVEAGASVSAAAPEATGVK